MSDDKADLVRRFNRWSPEPLQCSMGGIPFNKVHLDAREAEIERLTSENKKLRLWAEDEQCKRHKAEEDRMNERSEVARLRASLANVRTMIYNEDLSVLRAMRSNPVLEIDAALACEQNGPRTETK